MVIFWKQHPTKEQLYSHLPPITKTIKNRGTRYVGHCWRSREELISDILLWTPSHARAKAGRLVRTYIQQLCADGGCSPEDLFEAIDDKEGWRERVRDIRADSATWWWWWWWWFLKVRESRLLYVLIYIFVLLPYCTHIFLYTGPSNTNNSYLFISSIDGTQVGTNLPVKSGPESNGNEWVLPTFVCVVHFFVL